MQKPKLFLLDAFALIYRSYFAFSRAPRINSKGLNTSAVYGFTNTLFDLLKKENPSHIAVVFDTAVPTARHVDYEQYKANRQEMPDDIRSNLPYIHRLLEALNLPVVSLDGYEADDLIGTLARKAELSGFVTYMMTPDKDYGQLVDENTFIYKPARLGSDVEIMGVREVCERWGIQDVKQVIDILGLMGDSVDNIPGVPGVGEKTAIQLVRDFGSVEQVISRSSELKGKLKERIQEHADKAILSKKLATILLDAPVEFEPEKLLRQAYNDEKLQLLFNELEFRRLIHALYPDAKEQGAAKEHASSGGQPDLFSSLPEDEQPQRLVDLKTIRDTVHAYYTVSEEADWEPLLNALKTHTTFCFDTETTSLDVLAAELVGLSFAVTKGEAWYIPVKEERQDALRVLDRLRFVFEDEHKTLIGQNIKYDWHVLANYGMQIRNRLFDTMIAHFLLQPDARHGMDALAQSFLSYQPISIESLLGKRGKSQISMREADPVKVAEYAAEDADITLQLKDVFEPKIEQEQLGVLLHDVELPLVPVLASMEREGIRLDVPALKRYSTELQSSIILVEEEIQQLAGAHFNVSSPRQVGEILFEKLKIIEKAKKTKTGQYSTGEDILSKLTGKHPVVGKILEFRELLKLKNTYVDTLPELVNPRTGRIHTSYNQVVAVTGRLSSDNPNLQNIPVRTEKGREIRKAFIPRDEEHVLFSADYSQIELRIVASLSGDENLCAAFRSGKDIHTATASHVFNVAESEVTREMRYKAKSVNFGILYGQGAFGLSENLQISRTEAKELIENYFREFSGLKAFMETQVEKARQNGYVETILGRKRWLRNINAANAVERAFAERNAINAPIQGSAADMIKLAMKSIHAELSGPSWRSKMILQVHDELVFDAYRPELDALREMVLDKMQGALPLNVPVVAESGSGNTWLEAH